MMCAWKFLERGGDPLAYIILQLNILSPHDGHRQVREITLSDVVNVPKHDDVAAGCHPVPGPGVTLVCDSTA